MTREEKRRTRRKQHCQKDNYAKTLDLYPERKTDKETAGLHRVRLGPKSNLVFYAHAVNHHGYIGAIYAEKHDVCGE